MVKFTISFYSRLTFYWCCNQGTTDFYNIDAKGRNRREEKQGRIDRDCIYKRQFVIHKYIHKQLNFYSLHKLLTEGIQINNSLIKRTVNIDVHQALS